MMILGRILLPFLLIALVVIIGQDWGENDEARWYDFILIASIVAIFACDLAKDQPIWQRFARWALENGTDALILLGVAIFVSWRDADPTLTGGAWLHSFAAEFILNSALFSTIYVVWTTVAAWHANRKSLKTPK